MTMVATRTPTVATSVFRNRFTCLRHPEGKCCQANVAKKTPSGGGPEGEEIAPRVKARCDWVGNSTQVGDSSTGLRGQSCWNFGFGVGTRVIELRLRQAFRVRKIGALQTGDVEDCAGEIRAGQIRMSEIGAGQIRAAERHVGEV